jgi:hypothetical protein
MMLTSSKASQNESQEGEEKTDNDAIIRFQEFTFYCIESSGLALVAAGVLMVVGIKRKQKIDVDKLLR